MDIYAFAVDMTAMQKRALEDKTLCLDDPRCAEIDRLNSLPDPPETESEATGDSQ